MLSEAEDEGARAEIQKQAMSAAADPWWLLDRLSLARLPDDLLRAAAAAVLSAKWTDRRSESAMRWLHWLAEDAWRRKRFVEAAVLCSAYPAGRSSDVPSEPIALLAAAWSVGKPGPVMSLLSARENLTDKERLVVAAVALAEIMLHGAMEAWTALENHNAALPLTWKEIAGKVGSYWNQRYQALPMESIRAEVGAAQRREAIATAWTELLRALGEGASANFKFESGTKTREHLYHENGPLGRLQSLAANRNNNGVAAWLASEAIDDLDDFLDDATRAATGTDDLLFERGRRGGKRRSYLKTLAAIVDAARDVVDLAPPAATEEESRRMDLARPVAEAVHQKWTALGRDVATLSSTERVVLEVVLDEICVIADWGAV